MNIILGFGKTEEDFEEQEFDFVRQFIKEKSAAFIGDKYDLVFTDEMIAELRDELKKRKNTYDALRDGYKEATEYPDRYSTYYFNILNDLHDLCVIFDFSHINRRHPLSPDGWGLMKGKKVYHADIWDFRD